MTSWTNNEDRKPSHSGGFVNIVSSASDLIRKYKEILAWKPRDPRNNLEVKYEFLFYCTCFEGNYRRDLEELIAYLCSIGYKNEDAFDIAEQLHFVTNQLISGLTMTYRPRWSGTTEVEMMESKDMILICFY